MVEDILSTLFAADYSRLPENGKMAGDRREMGIDAPGEFANAELPFREHIHHPEPGGMRQRLEDFGGVLIFFGHIYLSLYLHVCANIQM